jgi:hypothetical protein
MIERVLMTRCADGGPGLRWQSLVTFAGPTDTPGMRLGMNARARYVRNVSDVQLPASIPLTNDEA